MRITDLTNVRRAFQSAAWVIHEPKLDALTEVLSTRMSDTPLTVEEIQARIGDRPRAAGQTVGSVAVIPLAGTLYPKANLVTESSGGASVEQFIAQVEAAASDPSISAIVIDTDSPGGAAQGIPEAAARLRALRGTKPIVAVASGLMASGAYWLASQADSIVGAPSSEIGSVGAFMVHQDMSEAYAKDGVKNTIVRAGKYKAETNPFEPLTDEAREALQSRVDEAYSLFLNDLAKGRRVSVATAKNDFGQGRVLGPKAALAAGMIDKLGTLQSVIRDLSGPKAKGYMRASDGALPVFAADDVPLTVGDLTALVADALLTETLTLTPTRAGAAMVVESPSDSTPPVAEEHTVDKPTTAPDGVAVATPSREVQLSELAALTNNADKLGAWIMSGKSVSDVQKELLAAQAAPKSTNVVVGAMRETQKPWASFGEQLQAIMVAGSPGGSIEPRLYAAASGMSQGVPAEGGFLVAPEFSTSIWEGMSGAPDALLPLTDNYTVSGESITFNADAETSRATGSRRGGVQGYWFAEAGQMTASKPKFRQVRIEPQELGVFVYLTDKLLANSSVALQQYVSRCAADEITTMTTDAIVNGDGVGKPKGLLASAAAVSVAKETSQAAATINQYNVSKMWSRLHPKLRANAVWLHNVDVEPALDTLSTVVTNVAGSENVGGYANKVFDAERRTLKGRPLVACESCATLGTVGDLILWAPNMYLTGTRGGVKEAMSMHIRFDYNETAFRFVFAVDGQPWHASPITPLKGSNTLSSIVTLATRA